MENENFVVIMGFMVNELQLKGNELLIYAIIHGFSQCENQKYTSGLKYLMKWTRASKPTVISSLQSLMEKGLIEREEEIINKVKFFNYWSKNLTTRQKTLPNNIRERDISEEDNLFLILEEEKEKEIEKKEEKKNNIKRKDEKKKERKSRVFIKPTVEEVRAYCEERNNGIDAEAFVDFYTSKGWMVGKNPMKDWQAAVRTWEQKRKKDEQQSKSNSRKPTINQEVSQTDLDYYNSRFNFDNYK